MENNIPENNKTSLGESQNKKSSINYRFLFLIVAAIALIILWDKGAALKKSATEKSQSDILNSAIKTARAEEIYPMFLCPCCGQKLDPQNICCATAREMIDYIDSEAKTGKTKNEVILDFVKKYGLNSFADKQKQKEFREELIKTAPADRPAITINPDFKDLGDINQKKGMVTTFFELKNEGKTDLIISRLNTSCGCTSASIIYQDEEGPRFTMAGHGVESPKDWQITIPAGQAAQLKVYYDPDIHKDFRGFAIREIYIYSNDPIDFEKKVQIELNQID